jgi:hypothetical protein
MAASNWRTASSISVWMGSWREQNGDEHPAHMKI